MKVIKVAFFDQGKFLDYSEVESLPSVGEDIDYCFDHTEIDSRTGEKYLVESYRLYLIAGVTLKPDSTGCHRIDLIPFCR